MTRLLVVVSFLLAAWLGMERQADASTRVYVLTIGNNAPPRSMDAADEQLPTLKYADDDAAAFFTFTRELSQEAELLAVLDARSQQRFPDLARLAHPPSLAELRRIVARWHVQFEADRKAGHDPVFILFFSGHGTRGADRPASLVFSDGPMTQSVLYDEVLATLPARYVHLIVDACYAEGVVRPRDGQASSVDLSAHDVQAFTERITLARFPNVGAVIATSTAARAFEWDAIERGVFTHELLSGLRGAADVNGDGRIEYSELYAFVTAANSDVQDPRARLSIVARPPQIDRRAPLLDLATLKKSATLVGTPARLGRFYVEDALGNRLLDVHAEPHFHVALRIPAGRVYLRLAAGEARIGVRAGDQIALDALAFSPSEVTPRGAMEGAMERGLFAARYGPRYFRAFLDGRDEFAPVPVVAEPVDALSPPEPPGAHSPRTAGWVTLGAAGALAVTTGVFTALTLQAKSDYEKTALEREATLAHDRFMTFRAVSIVGAGATLVTVGVGTWLLLRGKSLHDLPQATARMRTTTGGLSVAW